MKSKIMLLLACALISGELLAFPITVSNHTDDTMIIQIGYGNTTKGHPLIKAATVESKKAQSVDVPESRSGNYDISTFVKGTSKIKRIFHDLKSGYFLDIYKDNKGYHIRAVDESNTLVWKE